MTDAGNISEQETSTRSSTPPSPTLPPHQERSEELRDSESAGESFEQQDTSYTFPNVDQQPCSPEQQRCSKIRKYWRGVVCHRSYTHGSLAELHTNARRYKKLSRFCLCCGLAIATFYAGAGGILWNNILTEEQMEDYVVLLLAVGLVATMMAIVCVSYWCHSNGYEAWYHPRAGSLATDAVRFRRQYEQVAFQRTDRSDSTAVSSTANPPV